MMACYFCREFKEDDVQEEFREEKWPDRTGQCTRLAVWAPVKGDHYCSHLRMESAWLPGYWRKRISKLDAEVLKQRGRAVEAEKKLKELRARLRAR